MKKPQITIVHCSDPHVEPNQDGEIYLKNFKMVIEYINNLKPDVVVNTGDMGSKNEFLKCNNKIKVPSYYIPGNHDIEGDKQFLSSYRKIMGRDYWYYMKNNIHLIGLNSTTLNNSFPEEYEQQKEWLINILKNIPLEEKIVLFAHHLLFIENPKEAFASIKYWIIEPPAREEILNLILNFKILAYCCGHRHIPMVREYKGIKFIAAPAISYSLSGRKEDVGLNIIKIFQDDIFIETIKINDMAPKI